MFVKFEVGVLYYYFLLVLLFFCIYLLLGSIYLQVLLYSVCVSYQLNM